MRLLLALGLVTAVCGVSLADDKTDPTTGKWVIESVTRNGTANDALKGAVREHAEGKYTITPRKDSKGAVTAGTYTIDATKTPIAIDMKPKSGTYEGKTLLGIVKLESDTLTIAFVEPGKDRPTKFDAPDAVIAVCKKAK